MNSLYKNLSIQGLFSSPYVHLQGIISVQPLLSETSDISTLLLALGPVFGWVGICMPGNALAQCTDRTWEAEKGCQLRHNGLAEEALCGQRAWGAADKCSTKPLVTGSDSPNLIVCHRGCTGLGLWDVCGAAFESYFYSPVSEHNIQLYSLDVRSNLIYNVQL